MNLTFFKAEKNADLKEIYDYTIDAFSDSPDFSWTLEGLKAEVSSGWELFGVRNSMEIVAAIFLKEDGDRLLTKNTGLRIDHQGSGYNHEIKGFFEVSARERSLRKVVHYCRVDNFRMYSLNESHHYYKTGNVSSKGKVVEWIKDVD